MYVREEQKAEPKPSRVGFDRTLTIYTLYIFRHRERRRRRRRRERESERASERSLRVYVIFDPVVICLLKP